VAADPDNAQALLNLGTICSQQGDLAQATQWLRRAVALAPRDARAQANLGYALLEAGHRDEAIAHLLAALQLQPDNAAVTQALRSLGVAPDSPAQ
jgi:Flp pilus assembly protein TadD